jgi:hypothetical protein
LDRGRKICLLKKAISRGIRAKRSKRLRRKRPKSGIKKLSNLFVLEVGLNVKDE